MRIVICEDNKFEAQELSGMIRDIISRSNEIIDDIVIFENAGEMLTSDYLYDLAFIDCRLPDMNGTELAKKLRENGIKSDFVFVSAYNEYAVEGYESDALRYLIKPVKTDKLEEAIKIFRNKNRFNELINIRKNRKPLLVRPSEIYYIEKSFEKVIIRLSDRQVETDLSLAAFERVLRYPTLIRSSRQFIVNLQHIKQISEKMIKMKSGETVTISRRCLPKVKRLYEQYLVSDYFSED